MPSAQFGVICLMSAGVAKRSISAPLMESWLCMWADSMVVWLRGKERSVIRVIAG